MGGTKAGGLKAAKTNKERHGEGFYARIGAIGGSRSTTGGFNANRELARRAGKLGGMVSRRNLNRNEIASLESRREKAAQMLAKTGYTASSLEAEAKKDLENLRSETAEYEREMGIV